MPDGPGLLTIGEFARRTGLSIRALRLYDRIGLLRPAEVVPGTGYRRYAGHQLYAGRLVALLRRLDMPLTEITDILGVGGPAAAERLAGYWTAVEQRLAAQRELAERLVRNLAAETPVPDDGTWAVSVRDVAEQHVVSEMRCVNAADLGWIREATARLNAVADRSGGPAGPRFVIFHGEIDEDAERPVEVCVPVPAAAATRIEPAHREAYLPVADGHFEPPRILSIYDAVRRWVGDHHHTVTGPPREVYRYAAGPGAPVCDVAWPFR